MMYDFTDDEVNGFGTLIDEALKSTGIKYAILAATLVAKLRAPYQAPLVAPTMPGAPVDEAAANDTSDVPVGAPVADAA